MVNPGLKWPPEVDCIELLNFCSYIMRSTFGATYHTNCKSERDAHRVCNTDLEETYSSPRTFPEHRIESIARTNYALPSPEILRMLPSTKDAVAPAPAKV